MSTRCIYIALCVYAKLQNIKVAFLSRLNGMTVYIKDCLHKRSNMNRITTPCGPRGMGMWVLKVIDAKFSIRLCPFHVQRIFCTVCVSRVLCLTLDCQTYCVPNTANTVMICVLSISLFVYLSLMGCKINLIISSSERIFDFINVNTAYAQAAIQGKGQSCEATRVVFKLCVNSRKSPEGAVHTNIIMLILQIVETS